MFIFFLAATLRTGERHAEGPFVHMTSHTMVCKGIDIRELIKAYETCGGAVRFLGLHGYVALGYVSLIPQKADQQFHPSLLLFIAIFVRLILVLDKEMSECCE
jgi:hypothetical protein